MNTIALTLDQIRELVAPTTQLTECVETLSTSTPITPRYVIVRGDRSGVFSGTIVAEEGRTVELTDCRHVWYWAGAANVADMALNGVARPGECKIVAPVSRLRVLDAIEIVDCTPTAEASLRAVPVWSKK